MDIRNKLQDVIVQVMLWDKCIGRLKWDANKDISIFQFSSEYIKSDINISPAAHNKTISAFYGNKHDKYKGLPEFIADSLPDEWGNKLFDQWLEKNNISSVRSNSLLKLIFIGKRGIGALEYVPEIRPNHDENTVINISQLQKIADNVYRNKESHKISPDEKKTHESLIELGMSVGGKHPKGIIARNKITGEFRSGQIALPPEYEYFILKFKENPEVPTSEVEMIYYEMALDAGIKMMPSELIEINGINHFMTKRFDRENGKKLFTQTMAALIPNGNDYMHLFFLCENLKVPYEDKVLLYRQMVFNHMAGITDDHNKNFSFIMNNNGKWRISPAYDVMFTANIWENPSASIHCLGLAGKFSHVTIKDLEEFAIDFEIKEYKKIIKEVSRSLDNFSAKCKKYNVPPEWGNKIKNALTEIFPRPKIKKRTFKSLKR